MTMIMDQEEANKWLCRIAATVALAIAWHWYQAPVQKSFMMGSAEKRERVQPTTDSIRSRRLQSRALEVPNPAVAVEDNVGDESIKLMKASNNVVAVSVEESPASASAHENETKHKGLPQAVTASPITPATATATTPTTARPPIKATHSEYPGLHAFKHWYDVEASLYRIYTIGNAEGDEIAPAFIPRSERGHVALKLEIHNSTNTTIEVFWVDHLGREISKGSIKHNHTFHQTTWIGHPWTFRCKETGRLLLHYIPYRVIPTTDAVPTTDPDDSTVGRHTFTLHRPKITQDMCSVEDPVFPVDMLNTQQVVAWCFQHMSRLDYMYATTLIKYFTNIVRYPKEPKYRQIRTAGTTFYNQVWNTPARGLLLAAGFVESGAFVEMGSMQPLSRSRVQALSTLLYYLEQWKRLHDESGGVSYKQPAGADGGGRAGFGRAGQMN